MNDYEKMKKLKKRYFDLVDKYGEEVTELKLFQSDLRELNKQHRMKAIKMFEDMILKIESKT